MLLLSFKLCLEVPTLLRKVSRLLGDINILAGSDKLHSLSLSHRILSESYRASFFHQASIGMHFNNVFSSRMIEEFDLQSFINVTGTCEALRQSLIDLDTCIKEIFENLPCNTTLCISFIGGALSTFLKDILGHHSEIHAWILVSRFNSNRKRMAALLPIYQVLREASDEDYTILPALEKMFKCPWGTAALVNKVLPEFKWIFREVSSGFRAANNTKPSNRRRVELDGRLDRLLRDYATT